MQYTFLGFSQERLLELQLDDRDAALLRYFVDFKDSGEMYSEEFEGEVYYWVKYDSIKKQLPIVGQHFKKDAIYRRFKKMAEKGVLKHRTKKSGGTFSFYTIGEIYYSLITSSEPTQPEIPFGKGYGSKTVRSDHRTVPLGSKTVPSDFTTGRSDPETGTGTGAKSEPSGSKTGAKDQSIKDQSIKKIEREATPEQPTTPSPALALFFKNFPDVSLNKTKQRDIKNTVTDEDAWKFTIWWWKFKEYRAERTDNMLDYYVNKAVPKLMQKQTDTPPQESLFAARKPDNGNGSDDGHAPELWKTVLNGLKTRINAPSFNTWVRPTRFLGQHDHAVQLEVPDDVFVYWLKEHYQPVIVELFAGQLGFEPELEFVVNDNAGSLNE